MDPKLRHQIPTINRRSLLSGAVLGLTGLVITACGSSSDDADDAADAPTSAANPSTAPAETTAESTQAQDEAGKAEFAELEKTYDARLGVYALDTGSGQAVAYQSGDLFAMCSTFKVLAVGTVLSEIGLDRLDEQVKYTAADRVPNSPVTQGSTSMSLGELCQAALQQSDNTAANLVVQQVGGPEGVTQFARALGDEVTRLDRLEPELNESTPGDERDTSSPEMMGSDLFTLLEGDTLAEEARAQLKDWLLGNTTGANRIRAAVPKGWKVADKTGSGSYGTANDIALVYPKGDQAPIVLSIMSSKDKKNADRDEKLIEEAARVALEALGALGN
nr:class A beta-lactamase [Kineosporia babensis]